MSLTVKYIDAAKAEVDVDIARCTTDKEFLYIEFAKILSTNVETDELEELEVRSRLKIPMEVSALAVLGFVDALVEHEKQFNTGYGIPLQESDKPE